MRMLTLCVFGALLSGALALWRRPRMPRYWPLLAVAAVPQFGNLLGIQIPGMFFVAIAAIGVWCLYNRAIAGSWIIAAGVGLNLLVMALHGGAMPISAAIVESLGYTIAPGTMMVKQVVVESSPLWLLSDWIVLPLGATRVVVSPGDLIIVAGMAWWLLFSRQAEKDQAHADIVDQTGLARTAHTSAARTE